ncbi:MAG: type II toxin-antitoxin system HicA family toxin [Betaproteobacteria bacterium]
MGRLRVFSGKDLCRFLSQHGFQQVRQRGSHAVMQKRTEASTVTVPVPMHDEVRIGTLQSIIRQSGLARQLFEYEKAVSPRNAENVPSSDWL